MDPVSINPAWILDNIGVPFRDVFAAGLVGFAVAGFAVFLYFMLRSGKGYSNDDADAHAEEYAGTIREAHGGLTAFLAISFAVIFGWTVFYYILNWSQFLALFQSPAGAP